MPIISPSSRDSGVASKKTIYKSIWLIADGVWLTAGEKSIWLIANGL
jgi:hypothetical protein